MIVFVMSSSRLPLKQFQSAFIAWVNPIKEKSNEITAIPALLKLLELKGCIVIVDAMSCQ